MSESADHFLDFECVTISGQVVDVTVALDKDNNIVKITTSENDKNGKPFVPMENDMSMFEMYAVLMLSQSRGTVHTAVDLVDPES